MRITDDHTPLIGRLAKITELGVVLENEYKALFGFGSPHCAQTLYYYCHNRGKKQVYLLFIDKKPFKTDGLTWFCLKEVGIDASGDYHWLTLDQLIVCAG